MRMGQCLNGDIIGSADSATSSWKKVVCFPNPRSQHIIAMDPGSSCVSRTATPSLERSIDCDFTAAIDALVAIGRCAFCGSHTNGCSSCNLYDHTTQVQAAQLINNEQRALDLRGSIKTAIRLFPMEAPAPAAPSASGPEAEWAKRLSSVSVSKATMDRLVMNWLVIEGYQEAAQRFMAESGTDGAPASTQHR